MIVVVNMIPLSISNETNQDSEPNLAVNPANPLQIAGSAFTPDPMGGVNCPIFKSIDGGNTWVMNSIVPSNPTTGDITVRFSGTTNNLYAGILKMPGFLLLNILRTNNFCSMNPMTVLESRSSVDQPYIQATTVIGGSGAGRDRIYVGNNDFNIAPATATIDQSLDAAIPAPTVNSVPIESRSTSGQDGPPIRTAVHHSGVVYGIYYGWRSFDGSNATTDVVVVRDDNWGIGPSPFSNLIDPVDMLRGICVVKDVTVPWNNSSFFGQERFVSSDISIAVDPRESRRVYIAWADQQATTGYTLHIRMSTTGGESWLAFDIRTIVNAKNPALAINSHGKLGFLYQKLVEIGMANERWETHIEITENSFVTFDDFILASVPSNTPMVTFIPYMGDYDHLTAVGKDFCGIFSTANVPDLANFPNGVSYQRNADFASHTLLGTDGTTVISPSIDPFFFKVTQIPTASDFYVRDWTENSISHDIGLEPSTNPVFFHTCDVWNRRADNPGMFNANDQPTNEDPQMITLGSNYAFARISRNSSGTAEIVNAHFLYSEFGTGSNYQNAGIAGDPTISFSAADLANTMTNGYQWDLPLTSSNHLCLAVEIYTSTDPIVPPSLLGHAPGWPSTDLMVINDNNKAQRNMGIYPVSGSGRVSFYAVIHNAATCPRDIKVRYELTKNTLDKINGGHIEIIGSHSEEIGYNNIVTFADMQPGENRWIGVTTDIPRDDDNKLLLPIMFYEIFGNATINGFGIAILVSTNDVVIKSNLEFHSSVFARIDTLFKIESAKDESILAPQLSIDYAISDKKYLEFLRSRIRHIRKIISELLSSERSADPFGVQLALRNLENAINRMPAKKNKNYVHSGDIETSLPAHTTLLHKLDALVTMLYKLRGDPADILQNVIWQRDLYTKQKRLKELEFTSSLIEKSQQFIDDYELRKVTNADFKEFIRDQLEIFGRTSTALQDMNLGLDKDIEEIKHHLDSEISLQKAHHGYLSKLQSLERTVC